MASSVWLTESGRPPLPGARTLSGYAIKWNERSAVRPEYDELFEPHSIDIMRDIRANLNHDTTMTTGTTADGIRLGLVGGGMESVAALKKVKLQMDKPPMQHLSYAIAILSAGLLGAPEEKLGEQDAASPEDSSLTTFPTES